MINKINLASWT